LTEEERFRKKKRRQTNGGSLVFPADLPICALRQTIIEHIRANQVVIITGETGSGKTTQIPKMCLAAGRGENGMIALTQPRRIAAVSIASRIASEMGQSCGELVGYKIRFEEKTSADTLIKVMTDGMLLSETSFDRSLRAYDTIIVDEAHERGLNIDFLLGYLKTLLVKRKDLKLIITSATIDTDKFAQAFRNAPVVEVSGRMFPVEVRYRPIDPIKEEKGEITYIDAAVDCVMQLQNERHFEDILIFLPTEQDIREACEKLSQKCSGLVVPLYARLSSGAQQLVFAPSKDQKIIVSTNIAETSLTIPGIKYVIDSGLARMVEYNPRSQTTGLPVKPISRSSADQRMGRCGRVQNGICIRLYSPEDYAGRPVYTTPEILRSNLAGVVLKMLSLNLGSPTAFPFIDPPQPKNIRDGIDILRDLGALTRNDPAEEGSYQLTPIGKAMAAFPLDPRISRMIMEAQKEGCINEIAVIAAYLSIQDPRERPFDKMDQAAAVHEPFKHQESDFLGYLRLWNSYADSLEKMKTQNKLRKFCREHFLSYRRMMEWRDIYSQILDIVDGGRVTRHRKPVKIDIDQAISDKIHRCILSGYLSNIACKKEKNIYTAAKSREVMIHPGSGLFNRGGSWIVAAEIAVTSRLFARHVANINRAWLEPLGGEHCRHVYWGAHWEKSRGQVVVFEKIMLFGLTIVEQRCVAYSRINPVEAWKIFIREALVTGAVSRKPPFLQHNLSLLEKLTKTEDKLRKRGMVADEETIAGLYEKKLPLLSDMQSLLALIKNRGDDFFLRFKEEELLIEEPNPEELSLRPDSIELGNAVLPCQYRFEPGKAEDGVTVCVPVGLLGKASSGNIERQLPTLLEEKVQYLLKAIPKNFRRLLPHPAEIARMFCKTYVHHELSLPQALTQFLLKKFKLTVPVDAWPLDKVPDHLNVRYSIIGESGETIKTSRDILALQKEFNDSLQATSLEDYRRTWEKDNISHWNFGTIPDYVEIKGRHGLIGLAYPALKTSDEGISLRLFSNEQEARKSHIHGIAALYALHFAEKLRQLKKNISLPADLKAQAAMIGNVRHIEQSIFNRTIRDLFERDIRSAEDFQEYAHQVSPKILQYGQDMIAQALPIIRGFADCRRVLDHLTMKNQRNRPVLKFLQSTLCDLQTQVGVDFLEVNSLERLREIPRYLKALSIRAERGSLNLSAIETRWRDVSAYLHIYHELKKSVTIHTSSEKKNRIEELQSMIEEYKISLFAQEMKTRYPVSRKRLDQLIEEINHIVY
jgi:ATP-dependent helicase HrpA